MGCHQFAATCLGLFWPHPVLGSADLYCFPSAVAVQCREALRALCVPVCWQRFALPRRKPHKWMLTNDGWGKRCVLFMEISKPEASPHPGH